MKLTPKHPTGVLILGGFNLFVQGALSFAVLLFSYLNLSAKNIETINRLISQSGFNLQLTHEQLKAMILSQGLISLIFAVSGAGILLKKEWARKLTLYFSFLLVLLAFFLAIFQPALIKQAVLQIIYPGTLIIYFTNKKVERYFRGPSGIS